MPSSSIQFIPPLPDQPPSSGYAARISARQWQKYEHVIRSAHAAAFTVKEIRTLLIQDHQFAPTQSQLQAQILRWGLRVYKPKSAAQPSSAEAVERVYSQKPSSAAALSEATQMQQCYATARQMSRNAISCDSSDKLLEDMYLLADLLAAGGKPHQAFNYFYLCSRLTQVLAGANTSRAIVSRADSIIGCLRTATHEWQLTEAIGMIDTEYPNGLLGSARDKSLRLLVNVIENRFRLMQFLRKPLPHRKEPISHGQSRSVYTTFWAHVLGVAPVDLANSPLLSVPVDELELQQFEQLLRLESERSRDIKFNPSPDTLLGNCLETLVKDEIAGPNLKMILATPYSQQRQQKVFEAVYWRYADLVSARKVPCPAMGIYVDNDLYYTLKTPEVAAILSHFIANASKFCPTLTELQLYLRYLLTDPEGLQTRTLHIFRDMLCPDLSIRQGAISFGLSEVSQTCLRRILTAAHAQPPRLDWVIEAVDQPLFAPVVRGSGKTSLQKIMEESGSSLEVHCITDNDLVWNNDPIGAEIRPNLGHNELATASTGNSDGIHSQERSSQNDAKGQENTLCHNNLERKAPEVHFSPACNIITEEDSDLSMSDGRKIFGCEVPSLTPCGSKTSPRAQMPNQTWQQYLDPTISSPLSISSGSFRSFNSLSRRLNNKSGPRPSRTPSTKSVASAFSFESLTSQLSTEFSKALVISRHNSVSSTENSRSTQNDNVTSPPHNSAIETVAAA